MRTANLNPAIPEETLSVPDWKSARNRLQGAAEFSLIAVFLIVCEWLVPGHASLSSMNPQPFWIPVLLLSVQYGMGAGIVAAVAAFGVSVITGLPEPSASGDFYTYLMDILYEPILWSVAALVLGELRSEHLRRLEGLRMVVQESDRQRINIADYCIELQQHVSDLERQLALQGHHPLARVIQALSELGEANREELRARLAASIGAVCGGATYQVYLENSGLFERSSVLSDHGDPADTGPPPPGMLESVRLQAAMNKDRSVVSALSPEGSKLLEGVGVFAAPIIGPDTSVRGVLVLDFLPPEQLDESTEIALAAVARELGKALQTGGCPAEAVSGGPGRPALKPSNGAHGHAQERN